MYQNTATVAKVAPVVVNCSAVALVADNFPGLRRSRTQLQFYCLQKMLLLHCPPGPKLWVVVL